MSQTYNFYATGSLRTPLLSLALPHPDAESVTRVFWLGSQNPTRRLIPDGGTRLRATLAGDAAQNIKLATSLDALASAIPGAALDLGTEITSPTPIYIQLLTDGLTDEAVTIPLTLNAREV